MLELSMGYLSRIRRGGSFDMTKDILSLSGQLIHIGIMECWNNGKIIYSITSFLQPAWRQTGIPKVA
jgi:hypothetical protein